MSWPPGYEYGTVDCATNQLDSGTSSHLTSILSSGEQGCPSHPAAVGRAGPAPHWLQNSRVIAPHLPGQYSRAGPGGGGTGEPALRA